MTVCKFYGWSLPDLLELTVHQYNSSVAHIEKYYEEMGKANNKK